jgi:xanthine dehydrogenase large subunit
VYHFPSVNLRTRVAKTNLPSKTAYRSFGKVQAVGITEQIIDHAAVTMGCEPEKLRELNFYTDRTAITPFGLRIENFGAPEIYARVKARAQVEKRQAEVEEFNRTHPHTKRGIASLAIKFPVSHLHSNGASVMVSISGSGAVTVHHSGCEIGQGINEKVARAVAKALRCPYHLIRIADINTDVLPNMYCLSIYHQFPWFLCCFLFLVCVCV